MSAYTPSFAAPHTARAATASHPTHQSHPPPRALPLGLLALAQQHDDDDDDDDGSGREEERQEEQETHDESYARHRAPVGSGAPFVSSTLQQAHATGVGGVTVPRGRPTRHAGAEADSSAGSASASAHSAATPSPPAAAAASAAAAPTDFLAEHAHARSSRLAALNLHTHMSETLIARVARAAASKGGGGGPAGGGGDPPPLHALLELDLSRLGAGQKIRTIGALECVPLLQRLCLSHQLVESIGVGLAQLRHLRVLQLEHNSLTRVEGIWHLSHSLEELHLGHNRIERLPRRMGEMQRLTLLRLQSNALAEVAPLVQALASLSNLSSLTLFANPLSSLPHARAMLVAGLPSLATLDAQAVEPDERAEAMERFGGAAAPTEALRTELRQSQAALAALQTRLDEAETRVRQASHREAQALLRAERAERNLARERETNARVERELEERIAHIQSVEAQLADARREFEFWRIDHQGCSAGAPAAAGGGADGSGGGKEGRPAASSFLSPSGSPFSPQMHISSSPRTAVVNERRNALEWNRTMGEATPRRLVLRSPSPSPSPQGQQQHGYATPRRSSAALLLPPAPTPSDVAAPPVVLPLDPSVRLHRAQASMLALLIEAASNATVALQQGVLAKQADVRMLGLQHEKVKARAEEHAKETGVGGAAAAAVASPNTSSASADDSTAAAESSPQGLLSPNALCLPARVQSLQSELDSLGQELAECEDKIRSRAGAGDDESGVREHLEAQRHALRRRQSQCEEELDESRAQLASMQGNRGTMFSSDWDGSGMGGSDADADTSVDAAVERALTPAEVGAQLALLLRKLESAESALHADLKRDCARIVRLNKRVLEWRARKAFVLNQVDADKVAWMQRRGEVHQQQLGEQGQPHHPESTGTEPDAEVQVSQSIQSEWESEFESQSAPDLAFLVHEALVPLCIEEEEKRTTESPGTEEGAAAATAVAAAAGEQALSSSTHSTVSPTSSTQHHDTTMGSPGPGSITNASGNASANAKSTSPRTGSPGGIGDARLLEQNELHLALSTLQLENTSLREQIEHKSSVCTELKRERRELRRALRDAQQEVAAAAAAAADRTVPASASSQHSSPSAEALARASARIDILLSEQASLRSALASAQDSAASAAASLEDAAVAEREELASLRSRVDDYEHDILLLNTQNAQMQRENEAMAKEVGEMQRRLERQRQEAEKHAAAAAAATAAAAAAAAESAAAAAAAVAAQATPVASVPAVIPARDPQMESQLIALQDQIAELESMLVERSAAQIAEVERLREQLQTQQQQQVQQQQLQQQQHAQQASLVPSLDTRELEAQQVRQTQLAKKLAAQQAALDAQARTLASAQSLWEAESSARRGALEAQQEQGRQMATDLSALVEHLAQMHARKTELVDLLDAKMEEIARVEGRIQRRRKEEQEQQEEAKRDKSPAHTTKNPGGSARPAALSSASSPSQAQIDAQAEAQAQAQALAALQLETEHARATLASLGGAISSAQEELSLRRRLAAEIEEMETAARDAAAEERRHLCALLEADQTALQHTRAMLESEQTALDQTRALLESEQAALEQTRTLLESEQRALEQTRALLESEQNALEQVRSQLKADQNEMEGARALLESERLDLTRARTERSELDREIQEVSMRLRELQMEKDALEKTLSLQQQGRQRESEDGHEASHVGSGSGNKLEARLATEAAAIARAKSGAPDAQAVHPSQRSDADAIASASTTAAATAATAAAADQLQLVQTQVRDAQALLDSLVSAHVQTQAHNAAELSRTHEELVRAQEELNAVRRALQGAHRELEEVLARTEEARTRATLVAAEGTVHQPAPSPSASTDVATAVTAAPDDAPAAAAAGAVSPATKDGATGSAAIAGATADASNVNPASAAPADSPQSSEAAAEVATFSPSSSASRPVTRSPNKSSRLLSATTTPVSVRRRDRGADRGERGEREPFCPASAPGIYGASPSASLPSPPPRDAVAHARALEGAAARAELRAQSELNSASFAAARAAQDQELLRTQRQIQRLALEKRHLRSELHEFAHQVARERSALAAELDSLRTAQSRARAARTRADRYVRHRVPLPLAHDTPEARQLEQHIAARNAARDRQQRGHDFDEQQEFVEADHEYDDRVDETYAGRAEVRADGSSRPRSRTLSPASPSAAHAHTHGGQPQSRSRSRSFSPPSSPPQSQSQFQHRSQHGDATLPHTQRRSSSVSQQHARDGADTPASMAQVQSLRVERDTLQRALSDLHVELGTALSTAQGELRELGARAQALRKECDDEEGRLVRVRAELVSAQKRWNRVQEQVARMPSALAPSPTPTRRSGTGIARRLAEQLSSPASPERRPTRSGPRLDHSQVDPLHPAPKQQQRGQEEKEQSQDAQSDYGQDQSDKSKEKTAATQQYEHGPLSPDGAEREDDADDDAPSLSALEVSQLQQRNRELLRLHTELIAQLRHNGGTATGTYADPSAQLARSLQRHRLDAEVLASAAPADHGAPLLLPKHAFLTLQDYHLMKESALHAQLHSLRAELLKRDQEAAALLDDLRARIEGGDGGDGSGGGGGEEDCGVEGRLQRVETLLRQWVDQITSRGQQQLQQRQEQSEDKMVPPTPTTPLLDAPSFATPAPRGVGTDPAPSSSSTQQSKPPQPQPSSSMLMVQHQALPASAAQQHTLHGEMLALASQLRSLASMLQGHLRSFSTQLSSIHGARSAAHRAWSHNVDTGMAMRERDGYILFLLQVLQNRGQTALLRMLPPLGDVQTEERGEEKGHHAVAAVAAAPTYRLAPGSAERERERAADKKTVQQSQHRPLPRAGASFAQLLAYTRTPVSSSPGPSAAGSASSSRNVPFKPAHSPAPAPFVSTPAAAVRVVKSPQGLSASASLPLPDDEAAPRHLPLSQSFQQQTQQPQTQPQRPSRYGGGTRASPPKFASPPAAVAAAAIAASAAPNASYPTLSLRFDGGAAHNSANEEEDGEEEKESVHAPLAQRHRAHFAEAAPDEEAPASASDSAHNALISPPLELETEMGMEVGPTPRRAGRLAGTIGSAHAQPAPVQSRAFRTPLNVRRGTPSAHSPSPFSYTATRSPAVTTPAASLRPTPHSAAALFFAEATGRADADGAVAAASPTAPDEPAAARAPVSSSAPNPATSSSSPLMSPVSRSAHVANDSLRRGLLASRIAGLQTQQRQPMSLSAALHHNPFQLDARTPVTPAAAP